MNNLEYMEMLVKNHPELEWEGWNVVWTHEDSSAYMQKNAVFKDGKWFLREVYTCEENGWNIPKKILRGVSV